MSVVLGIALICVALLVWPTGTTKDTKKSQTDTKFKIAAMQYPDLLQGLVAYFKFDEGSGASAADNRGGYTCTFSGTWASGKSGNALHTASTSQYCSVNSPSAIISDATDLTVNMFVKFDSFTSIYSIPISSGTYFSSDVPQVAGWALWTKRWTSTVYFTVAKNSGTYAETPGATLVAGQWYMLTGTFNKATKTASLYVNGALIGSTTNANVDSFQGTVLQIPSVINSFYVDGSIDEVQIYHRVLSDGEIQLLYQNPGYP
ncbi:Concanavalin A-like lectin/glucanases superfamily protein [Candidatus Anstonella stagnisolia]|nr:Concanavalin A-like lectin/glucanases superfamily protein [Candidatus Anstonella stagnisolia]